MKQESDKVRCLFCYIIMIILLKQDISLIYLSYINLLYSKHIREMKYHFNYVTNVLYRFKKNVA